MNSLNSRKYPKSLKTRLIWQFTGFVGVIMMIVPLIFMIFWQQSLTENLKQALSYAADEYLRDTEQRLEDLQRKTESFGGNHFVINSIVDPEGRNTYLPKLIENFSSSEEIDAVSIVDFEGTLIYTNAEAPRNYKNSPQLRKTLFSEQISMFIEHRKLIIMAPLLYYKTSQGALIVRIDLLKILSDLAGMHKNYIFSVASGDKNILSSEQTERTEYLTVYRKAPGVLKHAAQLDLSVRLSALKEEYLAPVRKGILQFIAIGFVLTSLAMLIAIRIGNGIAQPVIVLRERVRQSMVDETQNCYPLETNDELDELAEVFDSRTRQLIDARKQLEINNVRLQEEVNERETAQAELRRMNEQLEKNVQQRTAELKASETLYRTLVEASGDSVALMDANFQPIFVNTAYYSNLGFAPDSPELKNRFDFLHPEDRDIVNKMKKTLFEKGKATVEYRLKRADGNWSYISDNLTFIESRDYPDKVALSIAWDITKIKDIETELRKAKEDADLANRAKSAFLANMSHEIRTPMNGVIGMTGLLMNTELTGKQAEFVNTIRISGIHLLTLINDILDFSKIEAGRMELEEHPFELQVCIEEAMELVTPAASDKGLELTSLVGPDVPASIEGDITRLRQILVNLLNNAVKFTQEGNVHISVELSQVLPERVELTFRVKDTGIGLSPEQQDRLFKAFSQADSSVSRKYGGTGLGLAICKRLSELMGGTIGVKSHEGEGAEFFFTIRVKTRDADSEKTPQAEQGFAGRKILIIDDNLSAQEMLASFCKDWSLETKSCSAVSDIPDSIEKGETFDFILLDAKIPEQDTKTAIRTLRNFSTMQQSPIALLGRPDDWAATEKRWDFELLKPVKKHQLFSLLDDVFMPDRAESRSGKDDKPEEEALNLTNLHILVAEDNQINQLLATSLLEEMGGIADLASNGLEALDALHRQHYDLVLMDVQMPEMDGFEATKRIIEEFAPDQRPVIIAVTANAMAEDRQRCLDAGMDDYISKPIMEKELIAALSKAEDRIGKARKRIPQAWEKEVLVDSRRLFSFEEEFQKRLIELFLEQVPQSLKELHQYREENNARLFGEAAHFLKGSCMGMGAEKMAAICKVLQRKGEEQNLQSTEEMLSRLEEVFEETKNQLLSLTDS
ncbi:MAG: response regulator [Desulfamplus sp.]|nr:response regulator [Desulfamplus sp.]